MKHDFAYFSRIRKINRIFLIFAVCFFVGILNIFSSHHYCRKYLNKNARYELSTKTILDIARLQQEVKIFVMLAPSDSDASRIVKNDFERLMREYVEHNLLISAMFVDPTHESVELRRLSREVGILPDNVVVVQANGQTKVVSVEEFYDVHNGEVIGFGGERLLTSTINSLINGDKRNIYFTIGHGEFDINDTSPTFGLSELATMLRQKNFNVQQFEFLSVKDIPSDADLVIIAGPKIAFLDNEISLLKSYLDKHGGSLILALNGTSDRLFARFLLDHGICVMQDRYILPPAGHSEISDDLLIKKFAPHEITDELINLKLPIMFGRTCEVSAAEWESDNFRVTELIQADGNCDQKNGEFIVGTLFEKSTLNGQSIDALNGKMLVLGCANFLTNSKINILGNKILFCRAIDFMCGIEPDSTIHTVDIKKYRLSITRNQYIALIVYITSLCCIVAALGGILYVSRRK